MPDTQALSSKQGQTFKELAHQMLEARGGEVLRGRFHPEDTRYPYTDWPQVDMEARDRQERIWWIHARGSWRGTRPGLQRTDTVRKLIAVVYDLWPLANQAGVLQGIVTSHLPEGGTGRTMLDRAVDRGIVSGVFVVDLDLEELQSE